jgi:hypothetical protein
MTSIGEVQNVEMVAKEISTTDEDKVIILITRSLISYDPFVFGI